MKAVLVMDSADNTPIRLLLLSEEFVAVDDADCSLYRFSLYKEFDMHDTQQLTVGGPCHFELSAKEIDSTENATTLVSYMFTASSESECTLWIDNMMLHGAALRDCEVEKNQQDQSNHVAEKKSACEDGITPRLAATVASASKKTDALAQAAKSLEEAEADQQSPACIAQLREHADTPTSALDTSITWTETVDLGATGVVPEPTEAQFKV